MVFFFFFVCFGLRASFTLLISGDGYTCNGATSLSIW